MKPWKVILVIFAVSHFETVHSAGFRPQVVAGESRAPAERSNRLVSGGVPVTGTAVSDGPANDMVPTNPPYAGQHFNNGMTPADMAPMGDSPPSKADMGKYEYPDDYTFSYGGKGAGNVGNGLCTEKNKNRSQVKNGYCAMLSQILNDPGSCAHRAIENILAEAGPSGGGVGDLHNYCSTYDQLGNEKNKTNMFLEVLSTLITQESGWNAHATEGQWYKNGKPMGGKGLFQIGVNDQSQDPDCSAINSSSIYDPKTNLRCGSCIALKNLSVDHTMGHGTGDSGARGMARYFGPLRDMQHRKREAMANTVNEYCVANTNNTAAARGLAAVTGDEASQSTR